MRLPRQRAPCSALTTEGYQATLVAVLAHEDREAPAKQTAGHILLELTAHKLGQGRSRALLHGSVERVQVVAHYLVKHTVLGAASLVHIAAGGRRGTSDISSSRKLDRAGHGARGTSTRCSRTASASWSRAGQWPVSGAVAIAAIRHPFATASALLA